MQKKILKKGLRPSVICALTALLLVGAAVVVLYLMPMLHYQRGLELLQAGDSAGAVRELTRAGNYRDSGAQIERAAALPFAHAQMGDLIEFGRYEQDGLVENGPEPICWQVVDEQDGYVLVVSRDALDSREYNDVWYYTSWEECSLRKWLNNEFFQTAFNELERSAIPARTVPNPDNAAYQTDSGNDTQDHIFLLNIEEARACFADETARMAQPTDYARAQGAAAEGDNGCWWWLRVPGDTTDSAAFVNGDGTIYDFGNYVYITAGAVRPAFWVKTDSAIFSPS